MQCKKKFSCTIILYNEIRNMQMLRWNVIVKNKIRYKNAYFLSNKYISIKNALIFALSNKDNH